MARAGNQRGQPTRVRQRTLGLGGRLDRVDVEVQRTRVIRIACDHPLEHGEHLGGAALGLGAPGLPVVPGLRVHHGFGVEHEDRVVTGILGGHGLHRVGVGGVERGALGLRVRRVALLEGRDHRAILRGRAGCQFDRLGERGQRRRDRLGHHRRVDVRPEHQGLAPPGHGELRVFLACSLEGALRLGVIEREGPAHALVEVGLRLRVARSHLEGQRAEVAVQGHVAARGLHRLRPEGLGLALREDQLLEQGRTAGGSRGAHIALGVEERVVGSAPGGLDAAGRHQAGRAEQAGERQGHHASAESGARRLTSHARLRRLRLVGTVAR